MSEINNLARQAFNTAIKRGKTSKDLSHIDTYIDTLAELVEFREASEDEKSRKSWPMSSSAASPNCTAGE